MSGYKLGLVSISFRQYSPEEIIKAVKDAGLCCIEWGSDVHAPCENIKRLHEIASLQKDYGIICSSYGTYFNVEKNSANELQKYIDAAKILGTKILRLWCGTKSGDKMSDEEKADLFARCRRIAEIAEENDVILCMECHQGTFIQRAEDVVNLMEAVSSPAFRMYWQPFQWISAKESFEFAGIVAPYVEHIHVFNWSGSEKFSLHEGIKDWCTYLTAFNKPHTLLLEFMPDDRIESLPIEADALRVIIGG